MGHVRVRVRLVAWRCLDRQSSWECGVPSHKMNETFDAVVIGAGYIGSSVAYHLSSAGLSTALVDKGAMAAGASRANYGNIQIQDMELEKSRDLIHEGRTRFDDLENELGREVSLRKIGGLLLVENETQWTLMESRRQTLLSEGIASELIPAKRLHEVEPELDSRSLLGALYNPDEGQLDPFQLIWAYLVLARRHGLREIYFNEVTGFLVHDGHIKGVKTAQGTLEAPVVVLCTGAGTSRMGHLLGRTWEIPFTLGQAMVTEPIELTLRNHVSSASFFEQESAGHPGEVRVGLALSQSPHGQLLLGEAMVEAPAEHRQVPPGSLPAIAACVSQYFPSFARLRVLRGWSAAVAFTHDSCPWFGPVPGLEGLLVATAFRSTVIITPLVGELIAQMVTRGECDLAIDDFKPERTVSHADV